MAGGLHRRGADRTSLYERIHGTPPPAEPAPPSVRHCWVTDGHGRLPGLLSEWRRTSTGWEGYVTRPVLESFGWTLVTEWLPAGLLEPA